MTLFLLRRIALVEGRNDLGCDVVTVNRHEDIVLGVVREDHLVASVSIQLAQVRQDSVGQLSLKLLVLLENLLREPRPRSCPPRFHHTIMNYAL